MKKVHKTHFGIILLYFLYYILKALLYNIRNLTQSLLIGKNNLHLKIVKIEEGLYYIIQFWNHSLNHFDLIILEQAYCLQSEYGR